MNSYVYTKTKRRDIRKAVRLFGLGMTLMGLLFGSYIFFPLLSWKLYLEPAFASQSFASPIPATTIITKDYIGSLLRNTVNAFSGIDYSNVQNWVPATYKEVAVNPQIASYFISIPKLNIENAVVSTVDNDLNFHLVHFPGTAIPPARGTAAIFGHSTLPELFNAKNYKTIFATALDLRVGDTINVTTDNTLYVYKIFNISIVEAEDTSYLTQDYDDSYLTIITCTPPGTTWKRLIIKSKLEKM